MHFEELEYQSLPTGGILHQGRSEGTSDLPWVFSDHISKLAFVAVHHM